MNKSCTKDEGDCPYPKPHYHVVTANGQYVRYGVPKCVHGKDEFYCEICERGNK